MQEEIPQACGCLGPVTSVMLRSVELVCRSPAWAAPQRCGLVVWDRPCHFVSHSVRALLGLASSGSVCGFSITFHGYHSSRPKLHRHPGKGAWLLSPAPSKSGSWPLGRWTWECLVHSWVWNQVTCFERKQMPMVLGCVRAKLSGCPGSFSARYRHGWVLPCPSPCYLGPGPWQGFESLAVSWGQQRSSLHRSLKFSTLMSRDLFI